MRCKRMLGRGVQCENQVYFDENIEFCTPCRHVLLCQGYLRDCTFEKGSEKRKKICRGELTPTGKEKKKINYPKNRKMTPTNTVNDCCDVCKRKDNEANLTWFANGDILCKEHRQKRYGANNKLVNK